MRLLFYLAFALLAITEGYLVVRFLQKKQKVYLKSAVTSFGLFCLYLIAAYFFHLAVPYYILLLVMVTIFTHTYLGHYREYYRRFIPFDRCLHGFGSFSCALFLYTVLTQITDAGGSKLFRAVLVAALGITAGTLFELLEYAADKKQHTKSQKGLMDTDTDTLANLIGGLAAAVFAWFALL